MIDCSTPIKFINIANGILSEGLILDNPGGGTSKIERINREKVTYRRGSSTITVRWSDLYNAYKRFRGKLVSSTDLRKFAPAVFDSGARPAGHSCNCTFFFHLMIKMGLADGNLQGRGVAGDPFTLNLKDS
ncbi:MAG: hypothetical protein OXF20_10225 [Gammaproteobacteria bacterium]|nr:hypothetical protein [Gammaproteobacteria bacterium]